MNFFVFLKVCLETKFRIIFCKMVQRVFPFFAVRAETGQGNGSYQDPLDRARTASTIDDEMEVHCTFLHLALCCVLLSV